MKLEELVREGDPWAEVSGARAERLGAVALAGARARVAAAPLRRTLAVALAVVAMSAALAAVAVVVTRSLSPEEGKEQGEEHAVATVEPLQSEPLQCEPREQVPVANVPAERHEPPAKRVRVAPAPVLAPAPAQAEEDDRLGAESRLVLTALRQLRVDGDVESALATLDEYARRFPSGTLQDEAQAARREAEARRAAREAP